jgi:hypothetical protein
MSHIILGRKMNIVSLSRGSQQLDNPLGDHEAVIGKLFDIKNKYSYTPLSPLQRTWSWWTQLGSHLHEDSRRYLVTKSLGGVSCVSRSPLKEQDLCPHRNIFIPWTSHARLGAAPKEPFLQGNHKHSECEQPCHVGHGYPLNSKRQFRNISSHELDMDALSYSRDSSAARRR